MDSTLLDRARQLINQKRKVFVPGETYIPPSGQWFDGDDVASLIECALGEWYAEGKYAKEFEKDLRAYFSNTVRHVSLVNSGSSANLLAVTTITDKAHGNRRAKPGDEIITVSAGFPTTVNPIFQNGLVPVFVDVDLDTFVPDMDVIECAIVEGQTKGVVLAHPLGNPYDAETLRDICDEYGIWMIEDSCFVANTLVPTKDGTKHISDIVIGDKVLGFNGTSFVEVEVVNTGNKLVRQEDVLCLVFGNQQIRCTKNHKFYVKGAWKRADELNVGDEVYHSTWSEYVSWRRKEHKLTKKGRKILSDKMKENNPMFDPDVVKRAAESRLDGKMSHIEKRVLEVIDEHSLPIKYTGNFSFWIGNSLCGYKNPDFLFEEKKIVFEVYDPSFLYSRGFRDNVWEEEKASHYAKFGYKTVFLPLSGWINKDQKQEIAEFLRASISNGKKLTDIRKIRNPNKLNLEKEPKGYVRVYDITCAPYHNFCLTGGVLVHNCDALGGNLNGKLLGSFGDISTLSFYPAHQITAGEGGACLLQSPFNEKVLKSYRDWGRDCWCAPGKDNTCGKRFGYQCGDLPEGYDHKYTYSRLGYNLKLTDMQASLLVPQLKKLPMFVQKRRRNWNELRNRLDKYNKYLRFMQTIDGAHPSWFGFSIVVKEFAPFSRNELVQFLEEHKIGTRLLFGGNLIRQPAYIGLNYKVFQPLTNSDVIMRDAFWIGVHPSIEDEHLDYMEKVFKEFFGKYK